MPRKRKGADLSRSTSKARKLRNSRSERTEEQIQQQNTDARVRMTRLHQEPEDTRDERNEVRRLEQRQSRRFTVNRRRTNDQQRQQVHRAFISDSFLRLAFQYEPDIEYYAHSKVVIGAMDKECPHCHALKFKNEPAGMCCASGKVQLPEIETPPEPLNGLLIGTDPDSNVFLNSKIQFMLSNDIAHRQRARCSLNEHNELLKIFKSHMHQLQSDNHAIVINPDKTPAGEHIRRFNAPVVDDVAGIMVGDCTAAREIVIRRRNNNLQFIADTHRSYDALQYPLIFWKGQDGYCINIKQRDTVSGAETNKNVSSKDYYAYRLMIRRGLDNVILRCRELCQQFMVDMYAKIESERLRYLRYNQQKLRAEEYIHLRDAINNNADVAEIGNHVILPSSYVGSPRHMQEYIQDALTFVREYGRPCLFITFTCNPKWPEITSLLLPGQNAIHRHDITARVFRQKLKSLISFITKSHVFGPTRCWMYSVEWQKRGLPHAHILVWFIDKIRPEEIDSIISAEIPDPSTDQLLFDIVTTNMIHGPCDFTNDTVTNVDGYPIYRRRNPENGGQSFIKNIINTDIDIDNRWVVPYSPLLSKTYNAHINVEFCSSVKSIKYICNSNEAAWRIFGFPIHERDPAVVQLAIHLENDIRKVNGQQYPTYKDACLALGLLEDDNQWDACLLKLH
ncbi:hypothetical protein EVAR_6795_1 [Eumeta japonica]|uniref:Helitron helicase-like domain-containing protein n=1 Tax=Eumeta variegata TaxID=151549 RepID=A0A4C1U626_EUMVA|nr:hypothetical protein EVAR_6795_1 [Eumeta japonica]